MAHDPLCPAPGSTLSGCICADLRKRDARVRADEREKWEPTAEQIEEYATALRVKIEAEVRERIAQEIEAMCPHEQDTDPTCPYMQAALIARGGESDA